MGVFLLVFDAVIRSTAVVGTPFREKDWTWKLVAHILCIDFLMETSCFFFFFFLLLDSGYACAVGVRHDAAIIGRNDWKVGGGDVSSGR